MKNNPKITTFTFLNDTVLIEGIDKEKSDLVSTDDYDEKPELGRVVCVGEGAFDDKGERIPMAVKVGDVVYFNKYSPYKYREDGKDYYIVKEYDISAYYRGKN